MSYYISGVPSHEKMKRVIDDLKHLFPLGSLWYSRLGDDWREVVQYEEEGISFRSTSICYGINGKENNDLTFYKWGDLLNGCLISKEEVTEDISNYFVG